MSPESPDTTHGFPSHPASWYYFGHSKDIATKPVGRSVGGRRVVLYRDDTGAAVAMDARCSHLGADLGRGCVVGGRLRCPLHGWEYGSDGGCRHIPAGGPIPGFAKQATYPVAEVAGFVFVFNRPKALFPMPFFEGVEVADLLPAPAYRLEVGCAWELVSGNSFDAQHFACAHDRTVAGTPVVSGAGPFARRITVAMTVSGHSWRDGLTRHVSGKELTMSIVSWCGNLLFITAKFHKTTTYGLLCLNPVGPERTEAFNIIWVRRSRNALARVAWDPVDVFVRRSFIRAFLASDVAFLEGLHYSPARTIGADFELNEYLAWLRQVSWDNHGGGGSVPTAKGDFECESRARCSSSH